MWLPCPSAIRVSTRGESCGPLTPALSRAWGAGENRPALHGERAGTPGRERLRALHHTCVWFTARRLIYKLFLLLLSNSHKPKK